MSSLGGLEELIAGPGLAGLGPEPRPARLPLGQLDQALAAFFEKEQTPAASRPMLRAAVLLWHDHLDASHQISQNITGPDGSFLHGIMHRREPDYSNARYWFHRVGAHPCFPLILERVKEGAPEFGSGQSFAVFAKSKRWDPLAFVEACESASSLPPGDPELKALERIQELETRVLLEHILAGGRTPIRESR